MVLSASSYIYNQLMSSLNAIVSHEHNGIENAITRYILRQYSTGINSSTGSIYLPIFTHTRHTNRSVFRPIFFWNCKNSSPWFKRTCDINARYQDVYMPRYRIIKAEIFFCYHSTCWRAGEKLWICFHCGV